MTTAILENFVVAEEWFPVLLTQQDKPLSDAN